MELEIGPRASASPPLRRRLVVALALVVASLLGATGCVERTPPSASPSTASPDPVDEPDEVTAPSLQERQCEARGWTRSIVTLEGQRRSLLWKPPTGAWAKGAIVVLHGGSGHHFQFCIANSRVIAPQVDFTRRALEQGFAVFALESTDRVTDRAGRPCGKVWDDEVRDRPNLDLPFLAEVLDSVIPSVRNGDDAPEIFLTGLSSGGYMTVRAATDLGDRLAGFAAVSSGDPYGWHRDCIAELNKRQEVHGAGYDNETGKQITEAGSCVAPAYPNERDWDEPPGAKPPFRMFLAENDGVNDISCGRKVDAQLRAHGYPGESPFVVTGGRRSVSEHLWQDAYSQPILDFFTRQGPRGDG